MRFRRVIIVASCALLAACAGNRAAGNAQEEYVEIANPGATMTDNAPQTIWVPRSYVERGAPRGSELLKKGYEAVVKDISTQAAHASPNSALTPAAAGISSIGGAGVVMIPRFGMVAAVDGERVYLNVGRDAGVAVGQKLKLYRGGTVVEGLGLAPGAFVGIVEIAGFVGARGSYGLQRQGEQPRVNDLAALE